MKPMIVAVLLAILLIGSPAFGQSTEANIVGTVTDSSGAALAGATVSAVNIESGWTRTATANGAGNFVLLNLPVGRYRVKVESANFRSEVIQNVQLQVNQTARVDAKLQVGAVQDSVSVVGSTPIVQSETSSVGSVIDGRKIVELPLNGRQFMQLATLLPGVVASGVGGYSGTPQVSVNGARGTKTDVLFDGLTSVEAENGGIQFSPTIDSIVEFKLQAANFSAEYGRGPAVINVATKSGTNQIHGSLWEFLRNDKLDARNFFSLQQPPALKRNQFGYSAGGPVVKNKTFFFTSYEGTRLRTGLVNNTFVAAAPLRQGNFSSLLPKVQVKDPLTGDVFPGNIIPASRFSAPAVFFTSFIPTPNNPSGTFSAAPSSPMDENQYNFRVDHSFGTKDVVWVRYTYDHSDQIIPGPYPTVASQEYLRGAQQILVAETHTFTPRVLNEFRAGYSRFSIKEQIPNIKENYTVQSGIQGFDQTSAAAPGLPQVTITGYGGIVGYNSWPNRNIPSSYQLTDTFSIVHGNHIIKIGFDGRQFGDLQSNGAEARGDFTFNGQYSGDAMADYMLGYPSTATRSFVRNTAYLVWQNLHSFVQDDWKVSRNLTLNLGLRYELNRVPWRKFNLMTSFDPQPGKVVISSKPDGSINLSSQQISAFAYPQFKDHVITSVDAGYPEKLRHPDLTDFAPRVGLAWRPFGDVRTVVRAAAGRFFIERDGNTTNSEFSMNPPNVVDQTVLNNRPIPNLTFANYFPPISTTTPLPPPNVYGLNPYGKTAYVWQWNFVVQRALANNLALEVGYLGNSAHNMEDDRALNYAVPGPGTVQTKRPFPWFGGGILRETAAMSNYEALQLQLEKRYSQGLTFRVNYSYSTSISDCDSDGGDCYRDPTRRYLERGRSSVDFPQRFVASFVWELPFGKGKPVLNKINGWANNVIGGWKIAGIGTMVSGAPFTVSVNDNLNAGLANPRPNRIGPGTVDNPTISKWFNVADFATPPLYIFGNSGRDILRGPNSKNLDLSALKEFAYRERFRLEFRCEYFNSLNHTNFGNPVSNISSTTVGRILSAGPSRVGQLGLRLEF